MPQITITFSAPLNTSCQVGDIAYYVSTATSGGFSVNSNSVAEIGTILEITNPTSNAPTIICDTLAPGSLNGTSKYIFFGKDNTANLSSILGYYAEVKFICNAVDEAEIHRVGMEIFESSGVPPPKQG